MEVYLSMPQDQRPSSVPEAATQGGDVLERWLWAEPAVWTERMLTALEQGVKGGVWFSLMDKVFAGGNLLASYGKVAANEGAPGVDHVTVEAFGDDLEAQVAKLTTALLLLCGEAVHSIGVQFHRNGAVRRGVWTGARRCGRGRSR